MFWQLGRWGRDLDKQAVSELRHELRRPQSHAQRHDPLAHKVIAVCRARPRWLPAASIILSASTSRSGSRTRERPADSSIFATRSGSTHTLLQGPLPVSALSKVSWSTIQPPPPGSSRLECSSKPIPVQRLTEPTQGSAIVETSSRIPRVSSTLCARPEISSRKAALLEGLVIMHTCAPVERAVTAAAVPAGPPPMTHTSTCRGMASRRHPGSRLGLGGSVTGGCLTARLRGTFASQTRTPLPGPLRRCRTSPVPQHFVVARQVISAGPLPRVAIRTGGAMPAHWLSRVITHVVGPLAWPPAPHVIGVRVVRALSLARRKVRQPGQRHLAEK